MPRTVTYSSVTKFDSDGDGMLDTSAQGTRTRELNDQGNLVHDLSTTDLDGDGTPDFQDESLTYDANNNVSTEVTESHRTENPSLAKLVALVTDRGADGVINHPIIEQLSSASSTVSSSFTYDDQGRQITHTVNTDAGADGSINEQSVYTTVYTNANSGQSTLTVDTGFDGTVDKRFTAQNTYDQNNHLLTSDVVADKDGDGKFDYHEVITNVYDAQGHLVSEHQEIDRDANGANDFLYTAVHTYDAQGELISSKFAYDLNGDGTPDIETVVALTDQTTQNTGQTNTGQTNTGQTNTGQTNTGQTNTGQTNTGQTAVPDWLKDPALHYDNLLDQHDGDTWSWAELQNNLTAADRGLIKEIADYAKSGHTVPDPLGNSELSPGVDGGKDFIELNNLLTNPPEWFKNADSSGVDPKVIAEFAKSHPLAEIPPVTEAPPAAPAQATDLIHEHTVLFDPHAAHADMLFM